MQISNQPDDLVLVLRAMRATSDMRHPELTRQMATTNRRLTGIERTLAHQRADLGADAASNLFRIGELEERIEALEVRLARPDT